MKNYVPNELANQPNNVLLLPNPLILMMRNLLLLLAFAFYSVNISAQDSGDTPGVMEVKALLASLKANGSTSRTATPTYSYAENIEDLLYKAQPSVYYNSGVLHTYGEKPRNLFTDVQSLNGLNNPSLLKNNIEMIIIKINSANDLNATIDLSLFSSFKNLKYVYIQSMVNATSTQIASMVVHPEERLRVFYKIQLGESNQ